MTPRTEKILGVVCGLFATICVAGFLGLAWHGPTWAKWCFGTGAIGFIVTGVLVLREWTEAEPDPWPMGDD